jgi:hypothetical protein
MPVAGSHWRVLLLLLCPLLLLVHLPPPAAAGAGSAPCTVRPGTIPLDTDGNPVHAHGAGVYTENGTLFLLGMSMKEAVPADSAHPTKANEVYLSRSINLYSTERSSGLCGWSFRGAVLNRSTIEASMRPALGVGMTARVERPKLARAASGEYAIWVHVQSGSNSSYSNVAVATSPTLSGAPFRFQSNFFANDLISKDSTVFTDVARDGRSYFVRDTAHQCDSISPFSPAGTGLGPLCGHTGPPSEPNVCHRAYNGPGTGTQSHPAWVCEGVCMFRDPVDHRLFMLGSHLSGWAANGAMLFVSSQQDVCGANKTSWTYAGNPAVGPGNENTYGAQSTFVLPWNDTMMVVMLDRWHNPNETLADYVWLPLRRSHEDGSWTMRWVDSWSF